MSDFTSRFRTVVPGLGVRWTGDRGWAVFADAPVRRGRGLLHFSGPQLRREEVTEFSHALQIDEGLWIGRSGGLDDLVNHSCRPSAGLRATAEGPCLIALSDLEAGVEVTFDYATWRLDEPWDLVCRCNEADCRGSIGQFVDLPADRRSYYLRQGVVAPFIARGRDRTPRPVRTA